MSLKAFVDLRRCFAFIEGELDEKSLLDISHMSPLGRCDPKSRPIFPGRRFLTGASIQRTGCAFSIRTNYQATALDFQFEVHQKAG
jgi:hypothetical protein